MPRPSTPDHHHPDGSRTITLKRACNGCDRHLGDATPEEIDAAVRGADLPDVTAECGCTEAAR